MSGGGAGSCLVAFQHYRDTIETAVKATKQAAAGRSEIAGVQVVERAVAQAACQIVL